MLTRKLRNLFDVIGHTTVFLHVFSSSSPSLGNTATAALNGLLCKEVITGKFGTKRTHKNVLLYLVGCSKRRKMSHTAITELNDVYTL